MVPPIRSGSRPTRLFSHFLLPGLFLSLLSAANGQTPFTCATTATNLVVHAEGLTEQLGDILLSCSGGTPGTGITTNITVTLPGLITNRINQAGSPDAVLTVDIGSGQVPGGSAPILLSNSVVFNGVSFTIPTVRQVVIRIRNLRLAITPFAVGQLIIASLSTTNISLTSATAVVATAVRGLYATYATSGISCVGSPLPSTITFANLLATGTVFSSTRMTEGFGTAFSPKDAFSDFGTRIVVNYSGFPAGSQVFVPDVVAGSDTTQPTAGGDLGGTPSGGSYTPSATTKSLLLARVGDNGAPVLTKAGISGPVSFNTVSPVTLTNGAGSVTYEVIDSDPSVQESAQFPTFLGLAATPNQTPAIATLSLSLAPVSTVAVPTASDPVPRFQAQTPLSDCSIVGDCGAAYFPVLSVGTTPLQFTGQTGGPFQTQYVRVNNTGGGLLTFSASIAYQNGSGWLSVNPPSGTNNTTFRLDASPLQLSPGTYRATVTVDAGAAGSKSIPVTFTVNAPAIVISSVTNAATFQAGPLVPGSLATVKGGSFASVSSLAVAFDGIPARVLFSNSNQINLQVPAQLIAQSSSQMVVTVDGVSSAAQTVQLAPVGPGIFGVLNQDNSVNGGSSPAKAGSVVQIFATGLISSVSGPVTVQIGTPVTALPPIYAGAAPGLAGVQQVNVMVPAGLPGNSVDLRVCAVGFGSTPTTCSPTMALAITQ